MTFDYGDSETEPRPFVFGELTTWGQAPTETDGFTSNVSWMPDWEGNTNAFRLRATLAGRFQQQPTFVRGTADLDYIINGDRLLLREQSDFLIEYQDQRTVQTHAIECVFNRQ